MPRAAVANGAFFELVSILAERTWESVFFICFHGDNEAKSHWWERRSLEKMEERGYGGRGGTGSAKTYDSSW